MLWSTFAFELYLFSAFYSIFASPLDPTSDLVIYITQVATYDTAVLETATVVVTIEPTTTTTPNLMSSSRLQGIDLVTSAAAAASTTMIPSSISAPSSTISETDTVSPSSIPTAVPSRTSWSAPATFSDLTSFGISSFAYGQQNLEILDAIPVSASAVNAAAESSLPGPAAGNNSSSVLQLFYPESSINPGSEPQGGSDFYATPLDLSDSQNVTLDYSVFFPVDFEWVLAGKLPGIYGGHTGCSGGDNAVTCFSTRLMWREGGAGELYLYAPKDKQTEALCSTPPQSVCDAEYGLSIGRGSFTFPLGTWTHLRQTVWLNTPGL